MMEGLAVGPDTHHLKQSRIAVTGHFILFGLNVGLWAAHIPVVQARLGIDPATLGMALLSAAVGTILSQPAIGVLMARIGSRLPAAVTAPLSLATVPAMIMAPSLPFLFGALFAAGAFWGAWNVAMNTQASRIETLRGQPTMSTFHAGASLGMLGGAAFAGVLIASGWGNGTGALAVSVLAIVAALTSVPFLIHDEPEARGPAFVLPHRSVIGLGLLAFLMFIIEGGMIDWSALFLKLEKGASESWAAAGFVFFTAGMVVMRTLGNRVVGRLGRRLTVTLGSALVVAGFAAAIAIPSAALAPIGFALVGIGAANIVPILISAAAQTPGVPPSVSVGAVSTLLTMGFLVGPPVIGFVSNAFGLSTGIALMGAAGLIVAVTAWRRTWPEPAGR